MNVNTDCPSQHINTAQPFAFDSIHEELMGNISGGEVRRIAFVTSAFVLSGRTKDHAFALFCRHEVARQIAEGENIDEFDAPDISRPNPELAAEVLALSALAWLSIVAKCERAAENSLKTKALDAPPKPVARNIFRSKRRRRSA